MIFRQKSGRKMLDRGHFNEKTGRLNREKRSDTLKNSQNLQDGRRKRWRENQKSPRAFSSHNMMREKNSLDRREKERRQRGKNERVKGNSLKRTGSRAIWGKSAKGIFRLITLTNKPLPQYTAPENPKFRSHRPLLRKKGNIPGAFRTKWQNVTA